MTIKKNNTTTTANPSGDDIQANIPISQIDLSPKNYRRFIPQESITELAADIALHGLISPVTLRLMVSGRYEVVVGERRIRACREASLQAVPAVIKIYTDEQANEIRLAENLYRENPHPIDEAFGIAMMQEDGKPIDEIAQRLGKSKSFVYARIKLLALIPAIQEMFYSYKVSVSQAMELANLSEKAQSDFFEEYCKDWKADHFLLNNFQYQIAQYRCDLRNAPFDVQDAALIATAGACTSCPFNIATVNSLFPQLDERALCNNRACYRTKCQANFKNQILEAVEDSQPDGIIIYGSLPDENLGLLDTLDQTAGLPQYSNYEVNILREPTPPDMEDYTEEDFEEEQEYFDQSGYDLALQEYQEELADYQTTIAGEVSKGLYFRGREVCTVFFTKSGNTQPQKVTAKAVQEAIKQGTVTEEILQGEVTRLQVREERAKEIDCDKIQLKVYEQFCQKLTDDPNPQSCPADLVTARLLVYLSLTYENRVKVDALFFADKNTFTGTGNAQFYERLTTMTEAQYTFMVRMALRGHSESKLPDHVIGIALYQLAGQSGIDLAAIEREQGKLAKKRMEKLKPRLKDLEKRIKRLAAKTGQDKAA